MNKAVNLEAKICHLFNGYERSVFSSPLEMLDPKLAAAWGAAEAARAAARGAWAAEAASEAAAHKQCADIVRKTLNITWD